MLRVYSSFNSICTQKVFIASAKKQLPYVTQNVALFTNEQFKPEYLDECFPAPRLVPADPYLRAHAALASTCRRHGLAAWQPE